MWTAALLHIDPAAGAWQQGLTRHAGGVLIRICVSLAIFGAALRHIYPVRLVLFCLHIAAGLCTSTLVFPFCTQAERSGRIQRWSARLLRICGVTLVADRPPEMRASAMIVANHISCSIFLS